MGVDGELAKETGEDACGRETRANPSTDSVASAFGVVLDALSNLISPTLIDNAAWDRLRHALRELPVDPGTGFGFELRLAEPTAGADFYAVLLPGSALARHYIRRGRLAAPGSTEAVMGERLATIDADAPWCELLGLEYDVACETTHASPGLFARLRSDRARAGVSGPAIAASAWLAGAVGWHLTGGESDALGRAFDELAAGGDLVCDVGIMPGRPGRTFKITSRPMKPAHALAVLDRLQWQGPVREVSAFLSAFSGLFRSLRLTFGIATGGVSPRVGFELFQGEPGSIGNPGVGAWAPCLARLCADGLCLPEKMEGLLAWPGQDLVFCGRHTLGLSTGLTHIKVSFENTPDGPRLEAKAYPGAAWLPYETVLSRFASR